MSAEELASYRRVFESAVVALTNGQAVILDARGMSAVTVIPGAGATVTVTRVLTGPTAGRFGVAGAEAAVLPAASTSSVTLTSNTASVDWPYLRVATTGGTASVALV